MPRQRFAHCWAVLRMDISTAEILQTAASVEVRRVNPIQLQLVQSQQCVWAKTHTVFTPLQQVQCVFVVQARPESDRIGLVRGEQMAVYSAGHALQGPGSALRGWSVTV